MMKISEFAYMNDITVRALRHYENMGLITQYKIDDISGYRYYCKSQSHNIQLILYLKSIGFSLSEIKHILKDNISKTEFISELILKKESSIKDIMNTEYRLNRINELLDLLSNSESDFIEILLNYESKEDKCMMNHELFDTQARVIFNNAENTKQKISAISIDIDNFGSINNDYSYEVGDDVISGVKNSIMNAIINIQKEKNIDLLFERFGGDEFRILMNSGNDDCMKLIEHIYNNLDQLIFDELADDYKVTLTIGCAYYPIGNAKSYVQLFHQADTALYEQKTKLRGKYKIHRID